MVDVPGGLPEEGEVTSYDDIEVGLLYHFTAPCNLQKLGLNLLPGDIFIRTGKPLKDKMGYNLGGRVIYLPEKNVRQAVNSGIVCLRKAPVVEE